MNQGFTSITLSQEELFYLLAQLTLGDIIGIDTTPLAAFTAHQRHGILQAGRRALLARGLLVEHHHTFAATSFLAIMLQSIAKRPPLTVLERSAAAQNIKTRMYYCTHMGWIGYEQPVEGLHSFSAVLSRDAMHDRLHEMLDISERQFVVSDMYTICRLTSLLETQTTIPISLSRFLHLVHEQKAIKQAMHSLVDRGANHQALVYDGSSYWIARAFPHPVLQLIHREAAPRMIVTILDSSYYSKMLDS